MVKWPNDTFSVVVAEDEEELWFALDREGDPGKCDIREVPPGISFTQHTKRAQLLPTDNNGPMRMREFFESLDPFEWEPSDTMAEIYDPKRLKRELQEQKKEQS